jgi:hypothetical protein
MLFQHLIAATVGQCPQRVIATTSSRPVLAGSVTTATCPALRLVMLSESAAASTSPPCPPTEIARMATCSKGTVAAAGQSCGDPTLSHGPDFGRARQPIAKARIGQGVPASAHPREDPPVPSASNKGYCANRAATPAAAAKSVPAVRADAATAGCHRHRPAAPAPSQWGSWPTTPANSLEGGGGGGGWKIGLLQQGHGGASPVFDNRFLMTLPLFYRLPPRL